MITVTRLTDSGEKSKWYRRKRLLLQLNRDVCCRGSKEQCTVIDDDNETGKTYTDGTPQTTKAFAVLIESKGLRNHDIEKPDRINSFTWSKKHDFKSVPQSGLSPPVVEMSYLCPYARNPPPSPSVAVGST